LVAANIRAPSALFSMAPSRQRRCTETILSLSNKADAGKPTILFHAEKFAHVQRPSDMKAEGFKTILVYCVGPPDRDPRPRCCTIPKYPWIDSQTGTDAIFLRI
jgi:hypothetical protein